MITLTIITNAFRTSICSFISYTNRRKLDMNLMTPYCYQTLTILSNWYAKMIFFGKRKAGLVKSNLEIQNPAVHSPISNYHTNIVFGKCFYKRLPFVSFMRYTSCNISFLYFILLHKRFWDECKINFSGNGNLTYFTVKLIPGWPYFVFDCFVSQAV